MKKTNEIFPDASISTVISDLIGARSSVSYLLWALPLLHCFANNIRVGEEMLIYVYLFDDVCIL